MGDPFDPDTAQLLSKIQFGMALRCGVLAGNAPDNRYTNIIRVCNRTSKHKSMRAIRGIKHPDGYKIKSVGRPRLDLGFYED